MPRPRLSKIEKMLQAGEEFSLTDKEYKKKTGLFLPKNSTYLEKESAISRLAKQYGFTICVHERKISLEKE